MSRRTYRRFTYRRFFYRRFTYRRFLPHVMHADLRLLRITKAAAERAVEIEQQACRGGIAEVLAAEDVEHLGDELDASLPRGERPRQAEIQGEEGIIPPERIALQNHARGLLVGVEADAVRWARGT